MNNCAEISEKLSFSTQYSKWLFSAQELASLNHIRNKKYNVHISKRYPEGTIQIKLEDEHKVLNSYIHEIISTISKTFELRTTIEGTAISFYKRYFLEKTFINNDPKQIALTCLYLACKVEEMHLESIKNLAEKIKRDLDHGGKTRYIHFNCEHYGKTEKDVLNALKYDLKIYSVFTPLKSALFLFNEYIKDEHLFKEINEEILKLARISFNDQLIFKYTHGSIALCIINLVIKRKNLSGLKQIFGSKLNYDYIDENKIIVNEIENELKNLEKIDLKFQSQEKRRIMQIIYEASKSANFVAENLTFPKPIDRQISLKRKISETLTKKSDENDKKEKSEIEESNEKIDKKIKKNLD